MGFLPVVIAVVLAIWFECRRRRRSAKLPPGPYPFPIIGNILQLGSSPHLSITKLSKTYGPLMSLRLGQIYTVVVSSPEMAREVLQKHDLAFSRRMVPAAAQSMGHHKSSLVFLPVGDDWRKIRKICKEQMLLSQRMQGSEWLRQAKLGTLLEYVRHCCDEGRVVNVAQAIFICTLNLMSATLFSIQVAEFESDAAQEFKKAVENITRAVAVPNLGDYFSILKPLDLQGIKRNADFHLARMLGLIEDIINERLQSRSASSPKKSDLLETLLDGGTGEDEDQLTINFISHVLLDLFFAGSDTTATTAERAMSELLRNPEKMQRAKQEMRSVIGPDKQVQESDMTRLPYLRAIIKETLRCYPAAPFLIPRKSDCEVEIGGYVIPNSTQILVNVWAYSKDAKLWPDPDEFMPERFLDRKINYRGRDYELIPFGSGRRMCPGLELADRMVPMLLATLIHNFDWELEPGAQSLDMTSSFGINLRKAIPLKAIPIKPTY
uniref:CYP76 n=1 Tax=Plectranthus barbatus TaxID=41228 RepID=A0A0R5HWY5_9LAMI|nr:CYP76 [Plectranthus barbatus]